MYTYEIRVLRSDRTTDAIIEVMHLNDNAAVRAAKKMAGSLAVEVWRGVTCVYGGHHAQAPTDITTTRLEA